MPFCRVSPTDVPSVGSITSVANTCDSRSTANSNTSLATSNSTRGTGRHSQSSTWLTGGSSWNTARMRTVPASNNTGARNKPHVATSSSRISRTSPVNKSVAIRISG